MSVGKLIEAAAPWLATLSVATLVILIAYEFARTLPDNDPLRERVERRQTATLALAVIVLTLNGIRVAALIGYIQ